MPGFGEFTPGEPDRIPQIRETSCVITVLPSALRDQIAAGEVVERPSSVVKELLENALDAGAKVVKIEIEGGGLDRITVTDDGGGMTPTDALLCLQRHATSKIHVFDDLYALDTFGFRGEALPSIAGVSRFRLVTRTADGLAATDVRVEGGAEPTSREVGGPIGTSIEVRDLFYNVPARRKFLKSIATESGQVSDVCFSVALGRPEVSMTLVRDGRIARQWLRAPDRKTRALDALASKDPMVHLSGSRNRIRVEAVLSPPERARSGATGLHLLVNDRAVKDRNLARAVAMAFGSVLDPGRYPTGVVWIDVPSADVDVNVHPQKAEVRFVRGRELYEQVTRLLAASLAGELEAPPSHSHGDVNPIVPDGQFARDRLHEVADVRQFDESSGARISAQTVELSRRMDQALRPFGRTGDGNAVSRPAATSSSTSAKSFEEGDPWGLAPASSDTTRSSTETAAELAGGELRELGALTGYAPSREPSTLPLFDGAAFEGVRDQSRRTFRYADLRFLAQVRATYLLCEGPDGIYVLDQHAAAERVNFARLRDGYQSRHVTLQQLLVPEIVHLAAADAALVDELRDDLLALGLDARMIGEGRVAVHGIPQILSRGRPDELLRDVVDELTKTGGRRFGDAVDLVLATMACHGSVRAGDVLAPEACVALLGSLDGIAFAGYCPHGRPIVTTLPYAELEKRVGRR